MLMDIVIIYPAATMSTSLAAHNGVCCRVPAKVVSTLVDVLAVATVTRSPQIKQSCGNDCNDCGRASRIGGVMLTRYWLLAMAVGVVTGLLYGPLWPLSLLW